MTSDPWPPPRLEHYCSNQEVAAMSPRTGVVHGDTNIPQPHQRRRRTFSNEHPPEVTTLRCQHYTNSRASQQPRYMHVGGTAYSHDTDKNTTICGIVHDTCPTSRQQPTTIIRLPHSTAHQNRQQHKFSHPCRQAMPPYKKKGCELSHNPVPPLIYKSPVHDPINKTKQKNETTNPSQQKQTPN